MATRSGKGAGRTQQSYAKAGSVNDQPELVIETIPGVLVHGGFVDGCGCLGVYSALRRQGYQVTVVKTQPCRAPMTWR
jgi:hypothetical protein